MSNLLNQTESDQEIIEKILSNIRNHKGDDMTEIVFFTDKDGNVRQVTDSERIDRESLDHELDEAKAEVSRLEYLIAEYDRLYSDKPTEIVH